MIIQPKSGTQGLDSLGGLNQPRQSTVEDLLRAAVAEGGAVGEAAQRLMEPKKSFFSTMTEATMSTLSGFITTIQTPMYAVAGLLDPTRSIAEAVKERVSPGDVLMQNKPLSSDPWIARAGYQVTKFGVDTLLDPLTYVTFGASRGIIGLQKGASAFAGPELAKQLGKKQGMRVYLSESGEGLANRYLAAQRNGLRQTFLKNERIKMVNKGLDEDEITKRLSMLEDETSDYLIKNSLEANLSKKQASQAVANLAEKFPHLMTEFIDKGGVKFFGRSILSGQRIRAVKSILPGMTALDKAMEPVRGFLGNQFSTKYSNGQRMTDQFLDVQEKWKNIYEAHRDRLSINGARVKEQLKLTDQEWEFVTAAAEYGMKPSDPRAADIWKKLHGEVPTNGTIREDVWLGLASVQQMNKAARRELIASGIPVKDLPNYMPHLLVKEDVANLPFTPGVLKQTTNRTKFAKIATLVDENGVRMPVRMVDKPDKDGNVQIIRIVGGKEVVENVKFIDKSRELRRIGDVFERQNENIRRALQEVVTEIQADRVVLKEGVATRLVDDVARMLDDIPDILPEDKRLLAEEITKFVQESDVDKIIQGRLSRFYKDGVKLSNGQTISKPDLDKLATDIVMAKAEATSIVSRLNKLLAGDVKLPHKGKATPSDVKKMDKELADLAEEMIAEAQKIKRATINQKLDGKQITQLLRQVVARTSKSPAGLNRVIDRLIKNKQVAQDLKNELSDISRAFEIEKQQILDGANKFIAEDGKMFSRVRASVDEARKLGVDFEENALVSSLIASDDAIRVSTSRHFLQEVAEKFGKAQSVAPEGYVPVAKTGMKYEGEDLAKFLTNKQGEPILFPPEVAERLENFTNGLNMDVGSEQFLRAYDGLQNYFKAAVTSIFPAFHGRNALSNVFLAYNKIGYEALNPASHVVASNILSLERKTRALQRKGIKGTSDAPEFYKLMSQKMFRDKTGYVWTWGELRREIIDNVVAFHHKNLGQTDQLRFGVNQVKDAAQKMFPKTKAGKVKKAVSPLNPLSADNLLFKGGFKIGQTIEDYSRTMLFISHLKKVGDPIEAARTTKLALFDYSNLTKFEKAFMRRIVPFYSFSRKNLELQINTLLESPGRISQQIRAVQSLGDYFNADDLTDEELAKLPSWAQKGYNVVTKREGSHITLLRNLGTPLEELFNRSDPQENLGVISPLIKAPIEFMSGYSFFHGRPISEVTRADAYQFAPEHIKKWIGYTPVTYTDRDGNEQVYHTSFAPWRMHVINTIQPSGRFFSEVNRIEKAPDAIAKMNALFFGFGTREFDLQLEEQRRIKENEKQLQALLEQANIGYTFERYVPETDEGLTEL